MDPRKLLYFASVIEHGSFKKAAKKLLISQPALSTSIIRFEQSVGDQLLERSTSGVTPTPLGEFLYAHARLIREELERAELRVKGGQRHSEDVIIFGTLPSLATSVIPKAVCRWRETHATTTLRIVEKNQLELLLSLLRGELDFIVAQTECYGLLEGMKQRVLFRDRLHIVGRPRHPAQALEKPTWADLVKFPWIVQMIGRQRTVFDKLLAMQGLDLPGQLTECSSVDCIKSLLSGSDSLAMLPASAVSMDVKDGKIAPLDITAPLLNRDIAVLFCEDAQLANASRELLAHIEAGPEHVQ